VLVLQGAQGTGKTSFVELLAGEWYTTVNTRIDDKDTKMQATGAWFVELSELATAAKSTVEQLRGFLTQRRDQIRLPYGEAIEDFPRRCVFMGTTNADQPLSDSEGNRRYWVVSCGKVATLALAQMRDQLWAEAVYYFRQHEKQVPAWQRGQVAETDLTYRWWLTPAEQVEADRENDVYMVESPLDGDLRVWMGKTGRPPYMTAEDMAKKVWMFTTEQLVRDANIVPRINRYLKALGWKRVRRGADPRRYWAWVIPTEFDIADEGG
jgi:putative DNA primase/helicase